MALSGPDETAVRLARRSDAEKTLSGLRRFTTRSRWLSINNRYATDTIRKISSDLDTGGIQNPRHLAQYISASVILHCCDGWSYLGRALSALAGGDPHRALHLAYYAELRAAMSLLASFGVGVFDRKQFVIDAPNSVARLRDGRGTHAFAWNALETWAATRSSADIFAGIVTPEGRSLDDWLTPLGGGPRAAPQAQQWFLQWGMDLQLAIGDRDVRNESSYRPDGIPSTWTLVADDTLQFISDLWGSLEPGSSSRFESIDRQILRLTLENLFEGRYGTSAARDPLRYRGFVEPVVAYQGFSATREENILRFLRREIDAQDHPIFGYSSLSASSRLTGHLSVLSRSTLLLRVASGSASKILHAAGYKPDDVIFWTDAIGNARGLWAGSMATEDLPDLWADVLALLGAIDAVRATPGAMTFHSARVGIASMLGHLSSCERVAMWGLLPAR